jgi:ribonuclease HII
VREAQHSSPGQKAHSSCEGDDEARAGLGRRDRELLRDASLIVGIDEVGRGSLAGPVVVCGVSLRTIPTQPEIDDSKRVSPGNRRRLARWVRGKADGWAIVEIWPELIDRRNILEATRMAMQTAARLLAGPHSVVVTDAVSISVPGARCVSPKRADAEYFSVAAASIVAKAFRDDLMIGLTERNSLWEWERNKGYGSRNHRLALDRFGRSFLHRQSFSWSPVLP